MSRLVPGFILDNYRNKRPGGIFEAFTGFIDISGFTDMTQELMAHGREGAEVLSGIINSVFTPSIRAVYDNGGFVASFAGDAFTAVFENAGADNVLRAVFMISRLFKEKGTIDTRFGRFDLSAKIGLSYGRVEFSIIETEHRNLYYLRGEAVDGCAESEHLARKMQIIADRSFADRADIEKRSAGPDHFLIREGKIKPGGTGSKETPGDESAFVPASVLELKEKGEFREIVSCFINFSEKGNYRDGIERVLNNCSTYGGYLNRAGFGDKGGTILVLFGAPEGREKLYERACDFALSLGDIPGFEYRAGIAGGIAFAGFVGSEMRSEYTALGNVVNMSARIMSLARWGMAETDSSVKDRVSKTYEFLKAGYKKFKGIRKRTEVYELKGKHEDRRIEYAGRFIGRKAETEELKALTGSIFQGRFGGIIYIDGEAGIGKSRFIDNFRKNAVGRAYYYLQCDEILKKPFNPFISFLSEYFNRGRTASAIENFEAGYAELIRMTSDQGIKSELVRTGSFIRALAGLGQDGFYLQLSAEKRYKNTLYALKNLIKALSLIEPLILIIEDAHWIDSDSIEALREMARNVERYPFVIIAVCRPGDDGTLFKLDLGEEGVRTERLKIGKFGRADIKELLSDMLRSDNIPEDTLDFIEKRSEGNPFFAEQIAMYLAERGLFTEDYRITEKGEDVPSGISQIITARIDRLSAKVRDAVKAASVLGREFAVRVLKKLLIKADIAKNDTESSWQVERGYNEQIWDNITEIRYIFKHALIRDTVYELQLKASLRRLHSLAGNIIEDIYSNNIEEHYEELADHFDKSGIRDKAVEYLKKAGDKAEANYHNTKALDYYDRLLGYLEDDGKNDQYIDILLRKEKVFRLTGRLDDAEKVSAESLEISRSIGSEHLMAESAGSLGYLLKEKGKLKEARKFLEFSLELSEKAGYMEGVSKSLIQIGSILSRSGEFDGAMKYLERAVSVSENAGDRNSISIASGEIGIVHSYKGNYDKALECYKKMLALCKELGNKGRESCAYGNIGGVLYLQGDIKKAMENFEKSLAICIQTGDRSGAAYAYGNMGITYRKMGEKDKALEYYRKQLEISEEIGHQAGVSLALGSIINIFIDEGRYNDAEKYCRKNLALCKRTNDRIGLVYSLIKLGDIHREQGYLDRAMKCFEKSLSFCEEAGAKRETADVLGQMGFTYHYAGEHEKALGFYNRALEILRPLNAGIALCKLLFEKAVLLIEMNDIQEALDVTEEAYKMACRLDNYEMNIKCTILKHRIEKNEEALTDMLKKSIDEEELSAYISYELWRINGREYYRNRAMEIYRRLYDKKPAYEYRARIKELKGKIR